jgi:hypothetical protein
MDYFNTINSSKEAELFYAEWYRKLPDERKAKMLCDMYSFGQQSVKYNAKKENPFITDKDALMLFVEANLKDEFSPEIFAFIKKTMAEKSEKEWQERFKTMKNELGWTYQQMATFVGAKSGDAIKASINRKLPAFAKLAVCVFEEMKK